MSAPLLQRAHSLGCGLLLVKRPGLASQYIVLSSVWDPDPRALMGRRRMEGLLTHVMGVLAILGKAAFWISNFDVSAHQYMRQDCVMG